MERVRIQEIAEHVLRFRYHEIGSGKFMDELEAVLGSTSDISEEEMMEFLRYIAED